MNAVCIRTLGPPVVRVNGAELVALPAQRLRCALLVFLAVERETTRENVLATFWPERPVERARHAFSQTLYELRRLLGDDWVDVQGERVVVRGIAVDAVELEAAVARGDTETAVRLYGGPFLDGFALDLKPFEAWAVRRRAQLGRSHRKASRDRIAALLQAGNLAAALEVSRRWAELDPLEDEAEHRYLELLVQAGHRGDALRVYAEYERLLQRELQVEPLDETKELVARLRAGELESGPAWGEVQRARLQADISELNVLGVVNATGDAGTVQAPRDTRSSVAPSAARVEPVPANRRSSHLDRLAFALGGAAVLALLILGYGSSSSHSSASRVTPGATGSAPAVAILPFGVSDPALQKWRTGVLLSLAAGIDGAAGMHAVDPQAVLESLNENAGSANTISHAPDRSQALGVGRRTGARYAIAGNVVAIDSSVRITADLYETATGARLQEFQSEGSSAQMFALLDALAIEIIRTMVRRERRDAGVSRTDVGGHLTTSLPALKAYLQAEQLNQQSRFEEATQWYERALQSDGTFTLMFSRFLVRYSYVGEAIPKSVPDPLAPALRAVDHLSRRDALMVRANQEVARDNIPGAVNLLLQASREYPDDYEVWYSLGEITIHEAGDLLLGPEDALRAFSNAMQLNPSYGPPYEHLIELLLGERGDSARAVQVNSAYQRLAPDADHREWGPLSLALAFGSPTARARARRSRRRLRDAARARARAKRRSPRP